MDAFSFTFPAVRGVQASREYFIAMCPLRLVPRLFPLEGEALPPELQLQRILNKSRIPELVRYLAGHPKSTSFRPSQLRLTRMYSSKACPGRAGPQ